MIFMIFLYYISTFMYIAIYTFFFIGKYETYFYSQTVKFT